MAPEKKITIIKGGPYLVRGAVILNESIMRTEGDHREYQPGQELPQAETYTLCRCGRSKNPPFCDGAHIECLFDGTEVADRRSFEERAELIAGPSLNLYDDNRCAFARFCHRAGSDVWTLTEQSDDPKMREEAIKASSECPTGRLVHQDKGEGHQVLEPVLEPEITVLQDPEKHCSGPLYVKGRVPLVSADGVAYELQNRFALCRCGESKNMPFCDAMHIRSNYQDGLSGD